MRQGIHIAAIVMASLIVQTAFAQEPLLNQEMRNRIEFRDIKKPGQSLTWDEAIERGAISLKSHAIAPNDTYSSIIEQYGIRSDPNSIELYRRRNYSGKLSTARPARAI